MSAFALDPKTIGRIANYAASCDRFGRRTAYDLARLFAEQNLRSVCHRYSDMTLDDAATMGGAADAREYLATATTYALRPHGMTLGAALREMHSLEYQSCETPDWKECEAGRAWASAERAMIRRVPGYETE